MKMSQLVYGATAIFCLSHQGEGLFAQEAPTAETVDLLKQVDAMTIADLTKRMRRTRRLEPEVGQPLLRLKAQTESLLTELQTRLARKSLDKEAVLSKEKLQSPEVQADFTRIQQLKTKDEMRQASVALLTRLNLTRDAFLSGSDLLKLQNEVDAVKRIIDDIEKRLVAHENQGNVTRPRSIDVAASASLAEQRKKLEAALNDRPTAAATPVSGSDADDVLDAIQNLSPLPSPQK